MSNFAGSCFFQGRELSLLHISAAFLIILLIAIAHSSKGLSKNVWGEVVPYGFLMVNIDCGNNRILASNYVIERIYRKILSEHIWKL